MSAFTDVELALQRRISVLEDSLDSDRVIMARDSERIVELEPSPPHGACAIKADLLRCWPPRPGRGRFDVAGGGTLRKRWRWKKEE